VERGYPLIVAIHATLNVDYSYLTLGVNNKIQNMQLYAYINRPRNHSIVNGPGKRGFEVNLLFIWIGTNMAFGAMERI
jgi:hypothetical protein